MVQATELLTLARLKRKTYILDKPDQKVVLVTQVGLDVGDGTETIEGRRVSAAQKRGEVGVPKPLNIANIGKDLNNPNTLFICDCSNTHFNPDGSKCMKCNPYGDKPHVNISKCPKCGLIQVLSECPRNSLNDALCTVCAYPVSVIV